MNTRSWVTKVIKKHENEIKLSAELTNEQEVEEVKAVHYDIEVTNKILAPISEKVNNDLKALEEIGLKAESKMVLESIEVPRNLDSLYLATNPKTRTIISYGVFGTTTELFVWGFSWSITDKNNVEFTKLLMSLSGKKKPLFGIDIRGVKPVTGYSNVRKLLILMVEEYIKNSSLRSNKY